MLDAKNSNALVPGATFDLKVGVTARQAYQVRLLRAIYLKGQRVEAGELVEVAPAIASELVTGGKARREPVGTAAPAPAPKRVAKPAVSAPAPAAAEPGDPSTTQPATPPAATSAGS